jgi:hypothetical protein
MAELARTFVSRLRQFIGNRRGARRCPTRLSFRVTAADRRITTNGSGRVAWLEGFTQDISTSGLGLIAPAIRIGEQYLVGENRRLQVMLELPTGTVEMEVTPVRYEAIEEQEVKSGYIIGVRILSMSDEHRVNYDNFVHRVIRQAPLD